MKYSKIFYCFTVLYIFFSSQLFSQQLKAIDNKGTIIKVNNNTVTTSPTQPPAATALEGDVWFDNSVATRTVTKIFDGTNWVTISSPSTSVYLGFFIINAPGGTSDTSFTQNITGLPFQPSQIKFTAHANIESRNIDDDNGIGNNTYGIQNSFGTMHGIARNDGGGIITQQVIYTGGHGNSINDISRFSSDFDCIGIRYSNQNGNDIGLITAELTSFNPDGFSLEAYYYTGTVTNNSGNPARNVQPEDVLNESILVLYTAYK